MNPSDGASRGDIRKDCMKYGWEQVQPVVPMGMSWRSNRIVDLRPNAKRQRVGF